MSEPNELSSNRAGAVTEHLVAMRLLELGYNVATPMVPCRYDLVVDLGDELVRAQVKRGFADSREDTLRVNLTGSVHKGGTTYESVRYEGDEVDAFAIHDPINERVYWLWFEDAPKTELRRKYNSLLAQTIDRKL